MPKLRGARFTTEVIERYRRRESGVEEAMMETCLVGVSTRNVEDVAQILWGKGVSAGTVSNLSKKAFASVEEWRTRPLTCEYPYVFVGGTYVKRNWGGTYESVAVLSPTPASASRRWWSRGRRRSPSADPLVASPPSARAARSEASRCGPRRLRPSRRTWTRQAYSEVGIA